MQYLWADLLDVNQICNTSSRKHMFTNDEGVRVSVGLGPKVRRSANETLKKIPKSPKTLSRPSSYQKPKSRFVQHLSANITILEVGRALGARLDT